MRSACVGWRSYTGLPSNCGGQANGYVNRKMFLELLQALSEHRVEYILIGEAAATVHGSARLTQDIQH